MKLKAGHLALSLLGIVCAAAAIPASASTITTSAGPTYTYVFNLPDLVGGVEGSANVAQFTITWTDGAFGAPTSSFGGYSSSGSPLMDGSSPFVAWSLGYDYITSAFDLPEILLEYPNTSPDVTSLMFFEPESFWATPGSNLSFNNGALNTANGTLYWDPTNLSNPLNYGDTNIGASFATTVGGVTIDPPCSTCSITITETPAVSAVPEPSTLWMLGSGLVGLAGMVRRKIGMRS